MLTEEWHTVYCKAKVERRPPRHDLESSTKTENKKISHINTSSCCHTLQDLGEDIFFLRFYEHFLTCFCKLILKITLWMLTMKKWVLIMSWLHFGMFHLPCFWLHYPIRFHCKTKLIQKMKKLGMPVAVFAWTGRVWAGLWKIPLRLCGNAQPTTKPFLEYFLPSSSKGFWVVTWPWRNVWLCFLPRTSFPWCCFNPSLTLGGGWHSLPGCQLIFLTLVI